jgi:flagellar motor switch protein FliM
MIILAPLPGQCVITLSPNVCSTILEQRLGGKIEKSVKERVLTEIDQSLLRGLVEHMLNDLKAAWSKVVAIEPTLEDSTVNQHWVQMLMGNERVMLLTFELTIQGLAGTMNIYIPFSMLKPIANVLNPHVFITGRKEKHRDPVARQAALASLYQVNLPVKVYLGNAKLKLAEIISLKIGDVIQLETNTQQDLVMQVANQRRFKGQVGKSGNHIALQIRDVVHDDVAQE